MRSLPARLTSSLILMLALLCAALPSGASAQAAAAPPVFSHPRGFYTSPFSLALNSPGASIRYTLDGSTPSLTNGLAYTGPIAVSTTTAVRAIAYSATLTPSPVVTHSYIFLAAVRSQSDAPLPGWPPMFTYTDVNGTYPADYGMDPEVTEHPNNAAKFDAVMKALPTLALVTDLSHLWDAGRGIYFNPNAKPGSLPFDPLGTGWERPVSLEWINPDGTSGFQQLAGASMDGETSRRPHRQPKKNFRIAFSSSYGTSGLDFELFDASAPAAFQQIVLRNGGNRSWSYFDRDQRREADYINDEWARRAWLKMGNLAPRGTYVHLYLNGLYWGLYNVTERFDQHFLQSYNGLTAADYDIVQAGDDAGNTPIATAGTVDSWNQLIALVAGAAPITDSEYLTIASRVDVVNLADYFVHAHYIGKSDWPHHNWNAYRARLGGDTRFRFTPLENDTGLNGVTRNTTLLTDAVGLADAPVQVFLRLTTNAEFRQLLADRLHRHAVAPTGALTSASCAQIYGELAGIVDQAVIGESARWGDYMRDTYPATNIAPKGFPAYLHSRDLPSADADPANAVIDSDQKTWVQVRDEKLGTYCTGRSTNLVNQYVANGWYQTALRAPGISQAGGLVAANSSVTLNNTANSGLGDIYYTTDGSDPRAAFGAVAATATNGLDGASVLITQPTVVKARVLNGAAWSPLIEYRFTLAQPFENLVINEVHYSPLAQAGQNPNDDEFIELYNRGGTAMRLDGVTLSGGAFFQFPANTTLGAGQYLVLAGNPARFQERYGFAPFGGFTGSLLNTGETLALRDAAGALLDTVAYQPGAPWPVGANGGGGSLSLSAPTADNSLPASWFASVINGGTPGQPNTSTMGKTLPQITWPNPAAITYGTALGPDQFNATANVAGAFSYQPAAGTVFQAGSGHVLRVVFTPNNTQTYAAVNALAYLDVTRAPLTITADAKIKRYGTPNPPLTASYTGFVNGDTIASLDTSATLSTTAGNSSAIGAYPITAASATDANYVITFVPGTLTVTDKAVPAISWNSPAGITYGTALGSAQLNATAADGGQAVAGTFGYNPPLGAVLGAGQHTLRVTFTPVDTSNFVAVEHSVTISVAKAALTIRADDKYKQVGTANPPLTASYSGFVNGDTPASLDIPVSLSTTATTDSPVGTYPIVAAGAADANYAITFVPGTLTIGTEAASYRMMLPLVGRPQ